LMHQSLADDPMDHCKHQLMLEQAPSHTRPSLCDAHTAQSEQQWGTDTKEQLLQATGDHMNTRSLLEHATAC
jgi:hypothetical protein